MTDTKIRRPVIGIAPRMKDRFIRMNAAYAESIFAAGGIPVFLPYTTDASRLDEYSALDGFLFAGGVDVDPVHYGETVQFDSVEVDAARDAFEFALWNKVYPGGKPIFGICRGIQFINVALGGTLYQHIPSHSQKEPGSEAPQHVSITPGSRLYRLIGAQAETNTFHHQAIKRPADTLRVTAVSDDGTVEAVETTETGRYLLAVQWHPELLAAHRPEAAALFSDFVGAARESIE